MTGTGARRARWNLLLLEQVIATAYVHALGEAAKQLGATQQYFRCG